MKVRKRNGSIEEFNIDKIKFTLERVSDELDRPFTGWDLRTLTKAIEERIFDMNNDTIDSSSIHEIVVDTLEEFGFVQIAKAYNEFEKNI